MGDVNESRWRQMGRAVIRHRGPGTLPEEAPPMPRTIPEINNMQNGRNK